MRVPDPYFTTTETAEELGITLRWVYELLDSGRLRGTRVGNFWRIKPEDLETFSHSRRPRGRPRAVCAR